MGGLLFFVPSSSRCRWGDVLAHIGRNFVRLMHTCCSIVVRLKNEQQSNNNRTTIEHKGNQTLTRQQGEPYYEEIKKDVTFPHIGVAEDVFCAYLCRLR